MILGEEICELVQHGKQLVFNKRLIKIEKRLKKMWFCDTVIV